ncbi:MAG: hypothetical protein IIZ73_09195 [Ruminococcus sp.]|nr:hypothetical protein [Ruminococcus sp.]
MSIDITGMFFLFPRRVRIETSMTPAQCQAKLGRELTEYRRRPSLVAMSEFLKKHRLECCYYGSCEKVGGGVRAEIFYHRAKKYDGSSAGFFGNIEKIPDGKGSVITGSIRRTASVVCAAVVWTLVLLILVLALLGMREFAGAGVSAGMLAVGLGLILYDRSAGYIESYLRSFPERTDEKPSDT